MYPLTSPIAPPLHGSPGTLLAEAMPWKDGRPTDSTPVDQNEIAGLARRALLINFKTRSALNLRKTGTFVCAEHWSTEVWIACYAIGSGPVRVWRPGDSPPSDLVAHVLAELPILAHDAGFERVIWAKIMTPRHGWPEPKLEHWHSIGAMAAAMALPRELDEAARVLRLSFQKDMSDSALMAQIAKLRPGREIPCRICGADVGEPSASPSCRCHRDPLLRRELIRRDDPEIIKRGTEYCVRAVETERELLTKLQPLPASERKVWLLDQLINERGISVDLELARKAQRIVEDRVGELNAELKEVTGGAVAAATQIERLVAWLRSEGVTLPGSAESNGLSKDQINILLQRDLPTQVRRALEIRLEAAKNSTAKFDAFANRTSADGRIRDNLVYDGAARTGRWSGKGAQLQNLPRPPASINPADIDWALKFIGAGWALGDIEKLMRARGLEIIAACLRPMLIAAPGHDLIAADYNAVEARGTAWLAGADRMLGIFSRGEDPYLDMASQIYQRPPENFGKTSRERQLGKTAILGLGYQMGAKRFMETCEKDGVEITEDEAERVKRIYRDTNPEIPNLWAELEAGAVEAMRHEGRAVWCARRRIAFGKIGKWLVMHLPSGRLLWYPQAHLREREMTWETSGGRSVTKLGVRVVSVKEV